MVFHASREVLGAKFGRSGFTGASLSALSLSLLFSGTALAQTGAATPTYDDAIVVTARRDAEALQDIPVSVQVVSGKQLQELAINQATELSKLAPGLTIPNNTGITLRGVTWAFGSGTPATPVYYNEAPFDPQQTLLALFDVGQIEVLRGPQGTSRGAPSISGAITISTRRPDLNDFGGYAQGQYGTNDHYIVQGAVNAPIIKDKLAVRLAVYREENVANPIKSVNSTIEPDFRNTTLRATVRFEPTDLLSLNAMYQRRRQTGSGYLQVVGTGSPGLAAAGVPANFNGPALSFFDRRSVQDIPNTAKFDTDLITANASWEVLGHKITANYGRQMPQHIGRLANSNENALDAGNQLPGYEAHQLVTTTKAFFQTIELRVSSTPAPDRPFDYDIGWFSKHSSSSITSSLFSLLGGAFGRPGAGVGAIPGSVQQPNPRYVLATDSLISLGQVFDSFYGNTRFHLDDATELSGGLAIVRDRVPTATRITSGTAFNALPNPTGGFLPCAALGALSPALAGSISSPVYTGAPSVCDLPIAPAPIIEANQGKQTAALYNFSLSHKFTPDLMVYATTGSSYRAGLPSIANTGLPLTLLIPEPEKAKAYELGVKATIGQRLRISADVFQIDYKNQLTNFVGVFYFNPLSGLATAANVSFYRNIDSRVRGVELEIAGRPLDNLNLAANLSYAKIKSKGGLVPCNDPTRPLSAANVINLCPSLKGETLNQQAPFQATINGSYNVPLGTAFDAYVRFNVNYQGRNPNYGNFKTGTVFKSAPGYAVVDLFAGVTGDKGGWDIGAFAKNAFNKRVELSRGNIGSQYGAYTSIPIGYNTVGMNAPREIGVIARYAFGSR